MQLTQEKAHQRSVRGWNTRRRHNPHLTNIHKVGKNAYEWRRPNGETIPISGFKDREVATIAPAFHATDKHLKSDQEVRTSIKSSSMPVHSAVTRIIGGELGGSTRFKPSGDSTIKLHKDLYNSKIFKPEGVTAHEIGHAVGPGPFNKDVYPTTGVGLNRANEFGRAFQWKTPRGRYKKELPPYWNKKKRTHPCKGKTRQGVNAHEDFAETYRSLIGVPITKKPHKYFKVVDTPQKSRETYMLKHHLKTIERRRTSG